MSKNKKLLIEIEFGVVILFVAIFIAFKSCNKSTIQQEELQTETIFSNFNDVPTSIVSKEELPEWLTDKIDIMSNPQPSPFSTIQIFKGEWEMQTVYFIINPHHSCLLCEVYYEDGEKLVWSNSHAADDFLKSKKFVLIYKIEEIQTRSELAVIKDKYDFPIKPETVEWSRYETIEKRINALQIPSRTLVNISTEGLLETCLEFPYLLDILHGNNAQHGFEGLMVKFNGFQELFKRPDLINALIQKYANLIKEVTDVQSRNNIDKGMFSFRHFVLEFMLAQDVVIENLSEEQEKNLISLSFEHTKIKSNYPDIFSNLNALPTSLLYAKKLRNENQANADLLDFIKSPVFVDQSTVKYLENYINVKYK